MMSTPIDLNFCNTDAALLRDPFQAANEGVNTPNASRPAFPRKEIVPRPYIPRKIFLVYPSKPCCKLNITIAEGTTPEFTPRSLNTGYYPHFGHYPPPAPQFPSAPVSQLIPGRAFPPSHLLTALFPSHVPPSPLITPSPVPSSLIEWSLSPPPLSCQPPNVPATSATPSTRGSQRGRDQARRGRATRGVIKRGRSKANVGNAESFAADSRSQADKESELGARTKKGQNRGMNPQEKLVLIWECVKLADEYKPGTKGVFWTTIRELLKDRTGYDLVEPRNTVLC